MSQFCSKPVRMVGARDNDGLSPFKFAPSVGTQIALQPHEYGVWEGEWIRTDSDLENNYYSILRIQDVDDRGFTYSSECRNIPYGPNAMWSDEGRASFGGFFQRCESDHGRVVFPARQSRRSA